jgi:hypothetical protein
MAQTNPDDNQNRTLLMAGRKLWPEPSVGQVFGRLVVTDPVSERKGKICCCCACGAIRHIPRRRLYTGVTRSCGCLAAEVAAERCRQRNIANATKIASVPGHPAATRLPEYSVWHSMKRRCNDQSNSSYASYGARGITVCDEWTRSFPAFIEHIGLRPSASHQIDRKDNSRGYEPGNVRWALPVTQSNNRRSNHIIRAFGLELTISEWARRVGLKRVTIRKRLERGMNPEKALTPTLFRPAVA